MCAPTTTSDREEMIKPIERERERDSQQHLPLLIGEV